MITPLSPFTSLFLFEFFSKITCAPTFRRSCPSFRSYAVSILHLGGCGAVRLEGLEVWTLSLVLRSVQFPLGFDVAESVHVDVVHVSIVRVDDGGFDLHPICCPSLSSSLPSHLG
jgi:hypothetical protein